MCTRLKTGLSITVPLATEYRKLNAADCMRRGERRADGVDLRRLAMIADQTQLDFLRPSLANITTGVCITATTKNAIILIIINRCCCSRSARASANGFRRTRQKTSSEAAFSWCKISTTEAHASINTSSRRSARRHRYLRRRSADIIVSTSRVAEAASASTRLIMSRSVTIFIHSSTVSLPTTVGLVTAGRSSRSGQAAIAD